MNMFFIADKFHLTLEQLDEVMSVEEYYSWLTMIYKTTAKFMR